jgi:hypothetical protein
MEVKYQYINTLIESRIPFSDNWGIKTPEIVALGVFKNYLFFLLKSVNNKIPIPTPKSAPAKPSIISILNFRINFNDSIRIADNINIPGKNHFPCITVLVFNCYKNYYTCILII